VEYKGLTSAAERDVFQRVQLGMSLTAAEKLQAIDSPCARFISALDAKHIYASDGLTQVITFETKRGRNFQNLAWLAACCDTLPEHMPPTGKHLEKWLMRSVEPRSEFKGAMDDVLRAMWHLASKEEFNRGFREFANKIAPVEFVFIGESQRTDPHPQSRAHADGRVCGRHTAIRDAARLHGRTEG